MSEKLERALKLYIKENRTVDGEIVDAHIDTDVEHDTGYGCSCCGLSCEYSADITIFYFVQKGGRRTGGYIPMGDDAQALFETLIPYLERAN